MVEVRIPGLGHSLMEDGCWVRTSEKLPPLKDYLDPKGLAKKRRLERLSAEDPRQGALWHDMAPR